jgi:hypothetical protein
MRVANASSPHTIVCPRILHKVTPGGPPEPDDALRAKIES